MNQLTDNSEIIYNPQITWLLSIVEVQISQKVSKKNTYYTDFQIEKNLCNIFFLYESVLRRCSATIKSVDKTYFANIWKEEIKFGYL